MKKNEEVLRLLCPKCSKDFGDVRNVRLSYSDACFTALEMLLIMSKGYADTTDEERDAIQLVGELLWGHTLYGLNREAKERAKKRKSKR